MRNIHHQQANKPKRQQIRHAAISSYKLELLPRQPYSATFRNRTATLGFAYDAQVGVHAFDSDKRKAYRAKPNALAYVPEGCDVYSHSETGGEYLKITLANARIEDQRFSDAIDVSAIHAAQSLRAMLLKNDTGDALELERHILALKSAAAQYMAKPFRKNHNEDRMTPSRLRRVDEFIDANLDNQLTVEALAKNLRLSCAYFSRAFKAAIGKSPYDYIIDKRIIRARTLLETKHPDLSAIALASGFTSHSHLTTTFRNRLGVTPSQLRAMFV